MNLRSISPPTTQAAALAPKPSMPCEMLTADRLTVYLPMRMLWMRASMNFHPAADTFCNALRRLRLRQRRQNLMRFGKGPVNVENSVEF